MYVHYCGFPSTYNYLGFKSSFTHLSVYVAFLLSTEKGILIKLQRADAPLVPPVYVGVPLSRMGLGSVFVTRPINEKESFVFETIDRRCLFLPNSPAFYLGIQAFP